MCVFLVFFVDDGNTTDLMFTAENQEELVCVTVAALDDDTVETTEVFSVQLLSEDQAVVVSNDTATILVFDQDCKYKLCFN